MQLKREKKRQGQAEKEALVKQEKEEATSDLAEEQGVENKQEESTSASPAFAAPAGSEMDPSETDEQKKQREKATLFP